MVGELCGSLKNNVGAACHIEIVISPPAVYLPTAQILLADSAISLAAQNCSAYGEGAYTGEISAGMLEELRIPYVILGHSERRSIFKETEKEVGTKVARAMHSGLKVIACIGETLEQRESGAMYSVLEQQLAPIMDAVGSEASAWSNVVVAYEPVWAIGTGVVASPQQAQDAHTYIRKLFATKISARVAEDLRIIYGGSVNGNNCGELKSMEDVDGFLVGGASIKAGEFLRIIESAQD
jgi:triosephosphate isomerase